MSHARMIAAITALVSMGLCIFAACASMVAMFATADPFYFFGTATLMLAAIVFGACYFATER